MNMEDPRLDQLFQLYGAACPNVEPSADFMPVVWRKIEARRSFSFAFQRVARALATVSVVLGLLFAVLTVAGDKKSPIIAPTYAEALAADHTVEKTYYTEAIRPIPPTDSIFAEYK